MRDPHSTIRRQSVIIEGLSLEADDLKVKYFLGLNIIAEIRFAKKQNKFSLYLIVLTFLCLFSKCICCFVMTSLYLLKIYYCESGDGGLCWHLRSDLISSEAGLKEFEPWLKSKPRLKYGCFHLKLCWIFQDLAGAQLKPVFVRFKSRLKFIKFGLRIHSALNRGRF